MKLRQIFIISALVGASLNAWAFQKAQPFSFGDSRRFAEQKTIAPECSGRAKDRCSQVDILRMQGAERMYRNHFINMRLKAPQSFQEQLKGKSMQQSELAISLMNEIDETLSAPGYIKAHEKKSGKDLYEKYLLGSNLDLARKIAKRQLYLMVKRHWNSPNLTEFALNQSAYNDTGHDEWTYGSMKTVERLNNSLAYNRSQSKGSLFVFDLPGVGFVEIDKKTLNHGRVALDINSSNDLNRPEMLHVDSDLDHPSTSGSKSSDDKKPKFDSSAFDNF